MDTRPLNAELQRRWRRLRRRSLGTPAGPGRLPAAFDRAPRSALLLGLLLALLVGTSGCLTSGLNEAALPRPAPLVMSQEAPPAQPAASEGSLWRGENRTSVLFEDIRARRVGDVLRVRIVETSSASKSASTNLSRKSSQSLQVAHLFGLMESLRRKNRNLSAQELLGAQTENDFEGDGATSRTDNLTATISATVRRVLPNGNLYIEGYREITVNQETQYIMLSGMVRPEDVLTDNSILSTSIADARITYSGAGLLADKQKPGFLHVLFDKIWPF
ncbi:MAG: flagellar basal body L-ring protein FlgH [Candidatus Tectomicrobia bacterium]|nr:flagellar basal body L-ring protein FlgH [Candidatus Tectomicrobia bacterium]